MTWLKRLKIISMILVMMISLGYSQSSTANALEVAYDIKIDSLLTQKKFETLQDSYDLRIKQLERENDRQMWLIIALTAGLSYSVAK